jgi:hypothetical protein
MKKFNLSNINTIFVRGLKEIVELFNVIMRLRLKIGLVLITDGTGKY